MSDTITISLDHEKQVQQEFDFDDISSIDMNTTVGLGVDTITLSSSTLYNYPSLTGANTTSIFNNSSPYISITDNTSVWNTTSTSPYMGSGALKVIGDADIDGDLKVQGVSLTERLDKIEERLAILRPNESLEEKWDELKELGKRYRELEKEIIEKEKVWEILKK